MELFRTDSFYIFKKGENSLWCDRSTGCFIPKTAWSLAEADDPICIGICDGIIGKVSASMFDTRLIIIKESIHVGKLHGDNDVYKIKSIAFVPLNLDDSEIILRSCPKHKNMNNNPKQQSNSIFDIQKSGAFSKTWGTLKSAGNSIKNTTQQAAAIAAGTPKKKDGKDKDRFEKQIIEEFYKIFNDTNSFYYSHTTDLTNSLQRLCNLEKTETLNCSWRFMDDRFFWNKHMVADFIDTNSTLFDPWILPIIQGYVQIEKCKVPTDPYNENDRNYVIFTLCIISRRSRFRAGTRYKRRGVDEQGHVANYVETEQLIMYQTHEVSFVQIRGSVPVFWSQPGYKYRPPPRIDKDEIENKAAFEKHFGEEIRTYGPICAINLVDQSGHEKVIFDAYSNQIFQYNSPFVTYATFDFHEYCRGMHFENVAILMNAISDIVKEMNYCWRDQHGHICSQNGVFRVNCIDCLDRTNVVQTAIGKAVMEIQFCKLGLTPPEGPMPESIKSTFQLLWANNGDIISKQYAGTNALKGDYTRTGERKITGIMKDGMNSANRFYRNLFKDSLRQTCHDLMHGLELSEIISDDFWTYLHKITSVAVDNLPEDTNQMSLTPHFVLDQEFALANAVYHMFRYYLSRFKDSTRQGTIDLMLGNHVTEENFIVSKTNQPEEDHLATAEHVKLLFDDCKKMLIKQPEDTLGIWGLINADPTTGDVNETEIDSIIILTKGSYFVADYDDQVDKITKFQEVYLQDITLIECGTAEIGKSLFGVSRTKPCLRINYKINATTGYYHMLRATCFGFFNNMPMYIKSNDDEMEYLKAICESFKISFEICQLPTVPVKQGCVLEKRKTKSLNNSSYLGVNTQITRNVSEGQLLAIKSVGTKAITNVTQQFSKLNKIGNKFKKNQLVLGQKPELSSDSDDDDVDSSIFQPNDGNSSNSSVEIEQGEEAEEHILTKKQDAFLPSVGIVMNANNTSSDGEKPEFVRKDSKLDDIQLSTIIQNVTICSNTKPEIQINSGQLLDRRFSHSENTDVSKFTEKRSNSDYEMSSLNISQSRSESALKNRLTTKDFVFSPFSKLAKGVQNFGSNFDRRQQMEKDVEEQRKLLKKWHDCKTRLIAL